MNGARDKWNWNNQATVLDEPERFWLKVNKDGPIPKHNSGLGNCWLWEGTKVKSEQGRRVYGHVRIKGKLKRAHRVAWLLEHGQEPKNLVCHHCDNTLCVRPSHLYDGTSRQNSLDAARRSGMMPPRYALHPGATDTHCRKGHERPGFRKPCKICEHESYLRNYAKRQAKARELGIPVSHVHAWGERD